jgi:hypothetical protein
MGLPEEEKEDVAAAYAHDDLFESDGGDTGGGDEEEDAAMEAEISARAGVSASRQQQAEMYGMVDSEGRAIEYDEEEMDG